MILRISEINKEISIACQKYNIDFKNLDYNLITKIQERKFQIIIINSLYFWIFKILFKFPLTAQSIFKSFNGLNLKKFDNQIDTLRIKNIKLFNLSLHKKFDYFKFKQK